MSDSKMSFSATIISRVQTVNAKLRISRTIRSCHPVPITFYFYTYLNPQSTSLAVDGRMVDTVFKLQVYGRTFSMYIDPICAAICGQTL